MSRKDYALIARIIADRFGPTLGFTIAERFAEELHKANPTFNIVKFMTACKVVNDNEEELLK